MAAVQTVGKLPGATSPKIRLLAINGFGNVEGDVYTLLLALRYLPADLFEITVVTKPRGEVYRQLQSMPHLRLIPLELGGSEARADERGGRLNDLLEFGSASARIAQIVWRERIDLIYSIDRGVAPLLAALVSRLSGTPFVLNAAYPLYPQNGRAARFVLRQASTVQVHSQYLYNRLLPYVRGAAHMRIVPNGIDMSRFDPALPVAAARAALGVPTASPVVVMTGRLNQYKGQDDLIRAAALVRSAWPEAYFLIAGRGPEPIRQALERLIAEQGVGDRVRLIGYVPSLPGLLAAASVVAMPSWEEPFGLVALEGMAMGKPVVATNAGGVPEFLCDGESGLLAEPRSPASLARAISALFADPERAEEMGRAGRQQVEQHYTERHYIDSVTQTLLAAMPALAVQGMQPGG